MMLSRFNSFCPFEVGQARWGGKLGWDVRNMCCSLNPSAAFVAVLGVRRVMYRQTMDSARNAKVTDWHLYRIELSAS